MFGYNPGANVETLLGEELAIQGAVTGNVGETLVGDMMMLDGMSNNYNYGGYGMQSRNPAAVAETVIGEELAIQGAMTGNVGETLAGDMLMMDGINNSYGYGGYRGYGMQPRNPIAAAETVMGEGLALQGAITGNVGETIVGDMMIMDGMMNNSRMQPLAPMYAQPPLYTQPPMYAPAARPVYPQQQPYYNNGRASQTGLFSRPSQPVNTQLQQGYTPPTYYRP